MHMVANYVRIALRAARKHKAYTALNIAGLAIGIGGSLLMFLYVFFELSYDQFLDDADRIYRVVETQCRKPEQCSQRFTTTGVLASAIVNTYPEVEATTRLYNFRMQQATVSLGEDNFQVVPYYADSTFFDVFSFPLLAGEAEDVLRRPNTAVVTAKQARILFGESFPVGKTFALHVQQELVVFEVTGIMEDVPPNSHLAFDLLLSFSSLRQSGLDFSWQNQRANGKVITYAMLDNNVQSTELETELSSLARAHLGEEFVDARMFRYDLQGITSIYYDTYLAPNTGRTPYLLIFAGVGLLLLLIAVANYVNLATSRSFTRAREIGVRKACGAHRVQLVRQFVNESLVLTWLALPLAIGCVWMVLPAFNMLVERHIPIETLGHPIFILIVLVLTCSIGVLAGAYPAVIMARVRPVHVFRGEMGWGIKRTHLRKSLIVFQLVISLALIYGTLVMQRQLAFMEQKDMGFDPGEVMVVSVDDRTLWGQFDAFKAAFAAHPDVAQVAASQGTPFLRFGQYKLEYSVGEETFYFDVAGVDYDYLSTMAMQVVAGRMFDPERPADASDAVILNEAAVQALGWLSAEEAIGKRIEGRGEVIGIVQDFHIYPLHWPVRPVLFTIDLEQHWHITVRLIEEPSVAVLRHLEAAWEDLVPNQPLAYTVLADEMTGLYQTEHRTRQLLINFSWLAVGIALLGVFGLMAFSARQRTKELGIRKVLGATPEALVFLLSKEYFGLVVVGIILAIPLSYLAMSEWLQEFAYRIALPWGDYLLLGCSALAVVLLIVGMQAVRAARINPVQSLRVDTQ